VSRLSGLARAASRRSRVGQRHEDIDEHGRIVRQMDDDRDLELALRRRQGALD
jgi:hypothetical protein